MEKKFQIIYLNGPSSSGKTTLEQALQQEFDIPFLHTGIDCIIGMMPNKLNNWEVGPATLGFSWKQSIDETGTAVHEIQTGPFGKKMVLALKEIVLALVGMGHHVIVDDVSFGKREVDEWKEALKDYNVLWVGIKAPLKALEARETNRGNRMHGSARAQYCIVHQDVDYDLEFDTSKDSLEAIVGTIKQRCIGDYKTSLGTAAPKKVTRIGVYGVVMEEGKILAVRQKSGPYAGKLDFPGGGIEFGESAERALAREFAEEVAMEFESLQLIDNLTATVDVPKISSQEPYLLYQIGMIYRVHGCRLTKEHKQGDLQHVWIGLMELTEAECSKLLWKWWMTQMRAQK